MDQPSTSALSAEHDSRIAELELLRARDQRALAIFHNVAVAGRGRGGLRALFQAVCDELRAIFDLDSCFVALCDARDPNRFRATLLYDEGLLDYVEGAEFGPITGRMIRERIPLLIDDLQPHRHQLAGYQTTFGNTQKLSRAWMGAPLLLGDDAVGVISIQSYTPHHYRAEDHQLLQRVAQVVAVVLENANLSQHQRELSRALAERVAARTEELVALSAIAAETVLQRSLPELIDRTLGLILPMLNASAGLVRELQPDGLLHLLAQRGLPDAQPLLTLEHSLGGRVARENRPVQIGERLGEIDQTGRLRDFESLLAVPLRIGARVLGVLTVLDSVPHRYDQQQVDLIQVIGDQLAIAVENARLLAERERQIAELRALGAIGVAAVSAQDLASLLRAVHAALTDFMQIDSFLMLVYDPERDLIVEGVGIDTGQSYSFFSQEPPPPGSFSAWIIRHRQLLHLHDVAAERANYPDLDGVPIGADRPAASWLGVPLLDRDEQVIGVIAVQSYTAQAFTDRDSAFLINVASQVALHVQNVALMLARERQIRELDAIGQVGAVTSASFDLAEMLRLTYEALHRALEISSFVALLCDADGATVEQSYLIDDGVVSALELPGGVLPHGSLSRNIISHNRPLLFLDLATQAATLAELGLTPFRYGADAQPRSWAGVPLPGRSSPIGTIAVQDFRARRFDLQTIDMLTQVANHLSLGVQKVRLFAAEQAARGSADRLREVTRVLSAAFNNPDEVLRLIVSELAKVVRYDHAAVLLLDAGQLWLAAAADAHGERQQALGGQRGSAYGAAGLVAREARPLLLRDTASAPEWSADGDEQIRSWVGVPLIARGRVIGVLNLDARRPDAFSADDVAAAAAVAGQAALALDNARLYAEQITRVERELEIAREIQVNLFPRTLPQLPGYALAARSIPARETGGDFFDVLETADGRVSLMIGDASGKSIPGALLMAVARSIARSEVLDHREPELIMRETNRLVAHDIPAGAFVAFGLAVLDPVERTVTLGSAGQLSPICRSADGAIRYLHVPDPRLPLGVLADTPYAAERVGLTAGDTLVFYTDGVVEARDAARQLFGFERLEALIAEHGATAPESLIAIIIAAVGAFCAGAPPHDDMTIVVLQVLPEERA